MGFLVIVVALASSSAAYHFSAVVIQTAKGPGLVLTLPVVAKSARKYTGTSVGHPVLEDVINKAAVIATPGGKRIAVEYVSNSRFRSQ